MIGALWETLVLEHLQASFPDTTIRYWRDKPGREVDFVLALRRDEMDAIECKWDSRAFDSTALQLFRGRARPMGSRRAPNSPRKPVSACCPGPIA
jgi:predicted AAA+ superfamily ATPase